MSNQTLNPRYTFESYVVGANNQMAYDAAHAVALAPAQAYNPLFIHGSTGLGKTHLMHAIGHAVLRAKPQAKVACLTAEKFANDYLQALRDNAAAEFRRCYRDDVDMLLLDDVQFLSGREDIQEELSYVFTALYATRRQIVFTSERHVWEIRDIEIRFLSRFGWELPVEIQLPSYETRLAILRSKAALLKFEFTPESFDYIAKNFSKNIRTLEGALLKVVNFASLLKISPVNLDTTKRLLEPFGDN